MNQGVTVTRAVVLARGLGTRMRRDDAAAALDAGQAAMAASGLKAMIPVGRPFLDFVLSGLADAGFTDVCLVIGPEHDVVREHYSRPPERIRVHFAVQERPLGTADAVMAAREFAGEDPFVVLNGDNYYPTRGLAALRAAGAPSLLGFSRAALARGNVEPERVAKFALVDAAGGVMRGIVEKPDPAAIERLGPEALVSMNCWCFPASIFDACAAIELSPRGELELPAAVQYAVDRMAMRFAVVRCDEGVLDLSARGDIAAVKERLSAVEVRL